MPAESTQLDKFKEVAHELDSDGDPMRLKEGVGTLLKHKLVEKQQ
jgi:hypothetical protein